MNQKLTIDLYSVESILVDSRAALAEIFKEEKNKEVMKLIPFSGNLKHEDGVLTQNLYKMYNNDKYSYYLHEVYLSDAYLK